MGQYFQQKTDNMVLKIPMFPLCMRQYVYGSLSFQKISIIFLGNAPEYLKYFGAA